MGIYINPPDMSKGKWLFANGTPLDRTPTALPEKDKVLVCLVINAFFTTAAVCHNQSKFEEFTDPSDNRPKLWFLIDRSLVADSLP